MEAVIAPPYDVIGSEYQKELLHFLYNTKCGRALLKIFVARPWFSKVRGIYQKSALSKHSIKPFIEKYNIDVDIDYALKHYKNFNDFFKLNKIKEIVTFPIICSQ